MPTIEELHAVLDEKGTVVDSNGDNIGKVGQIFLDDQTSQPEWVTVKTGLFGTAETFIPLAGAQVSGSEVRVRFDKDKVKNAPRVDDSEGHLSPDEETELYRYYQVGDSSTSQSRGSDHDAVTPVVGAPTGTGTDTDTTTKEATSRDAASTSGRDTSGPTTDDAMTRSEEQLNVGTEKVSAGQARLRKYVVTENVSTTVPVSHEEVRVEREPITDANRGDALSGGDITSEEHAMDLTQERVVVQKETVPVERVKMTKDTVTDEQTVNEEVRKEQIDTPDSTS